MSKILVKFILVLVLLINSVGVFGEVRTRSGSTWVPTNTNPGAGTSNHSYVIPSGESYTFTGVALIANLTINSGGSCTINAGATVSASGDVTIDGSLNNSGSLIIGSNLLIGGTISSAGSDNQAYSLNSKASNNTKSIELYSTLQNLKLSDILSSDALYKYLGGLKIRNNASFTIDKDVTLNNKLDLQGCNLTVNSSTTITTNKIDGTGTNNITGTGSVSVSLGSNPTMNISSGTTSIVPVLTVSGTGSSLNTNGGTLQINNSATNVIGTLNISSNGTFQAVGSPRLDITNIGNITGSLLLTSGSNISVTFPSSLIINGTSSVVDYLNKAIPLTVVGTGATISNSTFTDLGFTAGTRSVSLSNTTLDNITTSSGNTVTISGGTTVNTAIAMGGGTLNVNAALSVPSLTVTAASTIGGTNTLTLGNTATFSAGTTNFAANIDASGKTVTVTGGTSILQTNNSASRTNTIGTLSLVSGGTYQSTATAASTVNISTLNIAGKLILNGYTSVGTFPASITLTNNNTTLSYINKAPTNLIIPTTGNTITNCNLNDITLNNGSTVTSMSGNFNQLITDGAATLSGTTRVSNTADVTTNGSISSNGYLTMLDESNLYFVNNSQFTGTGSQRNVVIHRKYGSNGWVLFGNPFPGQTVANIDQQTVLVKNYVESISSPRWKTFTGTLLRGVGYKIGIGTITNDTLVYTGAPDLSAVNVTGLTFTLQGDYSSQCGYNLVSNPYTAPIDIATFFAANPELVHIKQWDVDPSGQGNGQYITRSSAGVLTPATTLKAANQAKINQSYFAPHQGFFIKLPAVGTRQVDFTTAMVTRNLNNNFLKSDNVKDYIRLELKPTVGTQTDCVIQFNDKANNTYNDAYDAGKILSTGVPDIYTYKGNDILAINVRKFNTQDTVPVGVVVTNAGIHTFKIQDFDAIPVSSKVFLIDSVNHSVVNMRETDYSVSLAVGSINNRFKLVFTNSGLSSNIDFQPAKANDVLVSSANGLINLDFANEMQNVKVMVVDLTGRIIINQLISKASGRILLEGIYQINQIYVISITGTDGFEKVNKIFVQ